MTPVDFKYRNKFLVANPAESRNAYGIEVQPLPIWTDGKQCVSCWKLSFRERIAALLFGRVWLSVLTGGTQPPVALRARREYFKGDSE